jgi:hypothetical protein
MCHGYDVAVVQLECLAVVREGASEFLLFHVDAGQSKPSVHMPVIERQSLSETGSCLLAHKIILQQARYSSVFIKAAKTTLTVQNDLLKSGQSFSKTREDATNTPHVLVKRMSVPHRISQR